jgi:hypothetical protein
MILKSLDWAFPIQFSALRKRIFVFRCSQTALVLLLLHHFTCSKFGFNCSTFGCKGSKFVRISTLFGSNLAFQREDSFEKTLIYAHHVAQR